MKKIFVLLCMCVCLVGCDNKNKLEINLEGNPTTGYEWTYKIEDENVLVIDSTKYEQNDSEEEMVGVGGIYNYIFKSVNEGETSITFEYARSFEENSAIYKITYNIKVDKDGKVSLVSKEGNYSIDEIPEPSIK